MNLAKLAPRILAGSAFAGFGFSFGRDVYKKSKENRGIIIAVAAVIAAIFGAYTSGIWFVRNYTNLFISFLMRVVAIITFFISSGIIYLAVAFIVAMFDPQEVFEIARYALPVVENQVELVNLLASSVFGEPLGDTGLTPLTAASSYTVLLGTLVAYGLLFVGTLTGQNQRKKRKMAWEAEAHNERFLQQNGIEKLDETNFVDPSGNRYRLENIFRDRVELFAIGRRNKRAYIYFDDTGKYTSWTGLVKIA